MKKFFGFLVLLFLSFSFVFGQKKDDTPFALKKADGVVHKKEKKKNDTAPFVLDKIKRQGQTNRARLRPNDNRPVHRPGKAYYVRDWKKKKKEIGPWVHPSVKKNNKRRLL